MLPHQKKKHNCHFYLLITTFVLFQQVFCHNYHVNYIKLPLQQHSSEFQLIWWQVLTYFIIYLFLMIVFFLNDILITY